MKPRDSGQVIGKLVALSLFAAVALVTACETPTAISVTVDSEVGCASNANVSLIGGQSLADLLTKAPSASSTVCTAASTGDGGETSMGTIVLVPATGSGEEIAFAIMTRPDGEPPDECLELGVDRGAHPRAIGAGHGRHGEPVTEKRGTTVAGGRPLLERSYMPPPVTVPLFLFNHSERAGGLASLEPMPSGQE